MRNKERDRCEAGIEMLVEELGVAIYNRCTMIVSSKQQDHRIEFLMQHFPTPSLHTLFLNINHGHEILMVAVDDGIEETKLLSNGTAGSQIVIGTDRNARGSGAGNVLKIKGVDVVASLCGFDIDELHARVMADAVPVDDALVMRDVDSVIVHPTMPPVYRGQFHTVGEVSIDVWQTIAKVWNIDGNQNKADKQQGDDRYQHKP